MGVHNTGQSIEYRGDFDREIAREVVSDLTTVG